MLVPTNAAIRYVLFDAANTLIHKPLLWQRLNEVLTGAGHRIPLRFLRRRHKLVSESFPFPDRTSPEFYHRFNAELLYSLGLIPTDQLLQEIFRACSALPWAVFPDCTALAALGQPLGIASNFNSRLPALVAELFGQSRFRDITASETQGLAKPARGFYQAALAAAGVPAANVLYVGDSIKLDMEPALALGMQAVLLDRDGAFPYYPRRIDSLAHLPALLA